MIWRIVCRQDNNDYLLIREDTGCWCMLWQKSYYYSLSIYKVYCCIYYRHPDLLHAIQSARTMHVFLKDVQRDKDNYKKLFFEKKVPLETSLPKGQSIGKIGIRAPLNSAPES